MHNCKTTRERLTELLLEGADPRVVLSTDLRACSECREEFGKLSETLRVTTRLMETAMPPESYWPGYHARLKERLRAAQQPRVALGQYHHRSWLERFFTSTIRIPIPVGIAAILLVGFAFVFSIRVPVEPAIVQVPVEVPVVQEKTVERIVYRDREIRPRRTRRTQAAPPTDPTLANLQGFKPAEEAKLTVIKGGSTNEK
jgi:hypothetical protein